MLNKVYGNSLKDSSYTFNDMGDRWSRSWAIARQSLAVLRANPELSAFPIVSGVVSLLVTLSFAVPTYLTGGFEQEKGHVSPLYYVVGGLYYFVSYFIVIFFNAGMVSCTNEALQGRKMTFGEGLRKASRHLGPILGWTLIAATVGMILRTISERSGIFGQIVVGLLGAAWNIVTFFVVPVLVLENVGPIQAVKNSTEVLKRTWGESLILNGGIGVAILLFALAPIPIFVALCFVGGVAVIAGIVAMVLYYLVLSIVASSLQGIWNTALYVYATTGAAPREFNQQDILAAFKTKPENKVTGYFRK